MTAPPSGSPGRGLRAVMPLLLVVLSFVLIFVGDRLAPGFATSANILQLLKLASFLGLVAIGQTIVMLTGGIDLSIAWVLTASAVVFTAICDGHDANIIPAAAAAISVGVITGFFNGFGVVKLRISPIVMTLAMNNIMLGATLIYTGGTPSGSASPLVRGLATGNVGFVPAMVILWCLLAIIVVVVIRYTSGGRMLLGVGENPRVSYLTGIRNDRVIIAAYVACGLTTSIGGILFSAFSGTSFLGMGDQFVLPTVAAVVLGGTSMFGGRGGYGGTMAAVFFTTILTTVLVIGNIPQGVRSIVFGLAVLAAILAQRLLRAAATRTSREGVPMAKRRIIDAHHHLWGLSRGYNYPWLQDTPSGEGMLGNLAPIVRDYVALDYRADTANYDLIGSVHLEAVPADALAETRWLQESAGRDGLPNAIVARVELQKPDAEWLAGHAAYSNVRGIRQIVNWHRNPRFTFTDHDFLTDPAWLAGYKLLRKYGYSFDLQIYPNQMIEAAGLAARNPETVVILNHTGMPIDRDEAGLAAWHDGMKRLAAEDNVVAKISGLGMVDHHWTEASIRPFVLGTIDYFGVDRAMFGSNFPVDKLYGSFDVLYGAFETIVASFWKARRASSSTTTRSAPTGSDVT